jgi:hypothetical protein
MRLLRWTVRQLHTVGKQGPFVAKRNYRHLCIEAPLLPSSRAFEIRLAEVGVFEKHAPEVRARSVAILGWRWAPAICRRNFEPALRNGCTSALYVHATNTRPSVTVTL